MSSCEKGDLLPYALKDMQNYIILPNNKLKTVIVVFKVERLQLLFLHSLIFKKAETKKYELLRCCLKS